MRKSQHTLGSEYKGETNRCCQRDEKGYRPNNGHKTIMDANFSYHTFVVSFRIVLTGKKRSHRHQLTLFDPANQICHRTQILIYAMLSLQNAKSVRHVGANHKKGRTSIIVRVAVMTISQSIEEATHPIITLLKFQNSSKYPTLMVKMVYAIPPAKKRGESRVSQWGCRGGQRRRTYRTGEWRGPRSKRTQRRAPRGPLSSTRRISERCWKSTPVVCEVASVMILAHDTEGGGKAGVCETHHKHRICVFGRETRGVSEINC